MVTRARRWRRELDAWAIPDAILSGAPESPWIHPPELFTVPDVIEPTPSHDRAREAMPPGGTVLDVGCGGGVAAFALTPLATHVIGVDHQPAMLEMFCANAAKRRVACDVVEGFWPTVAAAAARADIVTAHHVVYNVGDIVPFFDALDSHARRRVVLELPDRHPLSSMSNAWQHFWQLERPTGPTSADLVGVLEEMGITASSQSWSGPPRPTASDADAVRFMRVRLCLPAVRESEVAEYLAAHPVGPMRDLTTVWWDT